MDGFSSDPEPASDILPFAVSAPPFQNLLFISEPVHDGIGTVSPDFPELAFLDVAETVSGGWTFDTAATTFSTAINANAGLTTSTTDQALNFTTNGAGDFVFTADDDTNVQFTSTIGTDVTINPVDITITDNAAGIAEMAGMGEETRKRAEQLDAVGNSTAAIGKGFSVSAAALTASLGSVWANASGCFSKKPEKISPARFNKDRADDRMFCFNPACALTNS